jgi:hypothetical protein
MKGVLSLWLTAGGIGDQKTKDDLGLVKSHAKLLHKYLADDAKVTAIVEIVLHMQLNLYSLKRQEQARPK